MNIESEHLTPQPEDDFHAESLPPSEPYVEYKGLKIFGLEKVSNPFITPETVSHLFDRFPDSYWSKIPLSAIHFVPYEIYSAKRRLDDGSEEVIYATLPKYESQLPDIAATIGVDDVLQEDDEIVARKRGLSIDDDFGGKEIFIFSTQNWDSEEDEQLDADNALFISVHELGHLTWKMLSNQGDPQPFSGLPENQLERYKAYRPIVETEFQNAANLQENLPQLLTEEDFAVAHEHYFYWEDLQILDEEREKRLTQLYSQMDAN